MVTCYVKKKYKLQKLFLNIKEKEMKNINENHNNKNNKTDLRILQYCPMSDGNTYVPGPNLEVLTFS